MAPRSSQQVLCLFGRSLLSGMDVLGFVLAAHARRRQPWAAMLGKPPNDTSMLQWRMLAWSAACNTGNDREVGQVVVPFSKGKANNA